MGDSKQNDQNDEITEMSDYCLTSLVDVIRKISPYIPQSRVTKWRDILSREDLDYLIDLMTMPDSALISGRFTCGLYGHLTRIRSTPMIEVQITSNDQNSPPIRERMKYEGCYVDRRETLHRRRVLVKVNDQNGLKDLMQLICYQYADNKWKFYCVSNSQHGHYHITSIESAGTDFERLTWAYYDEQAENKSSSISLRIRAWNI